MPIVLITGANRGIGLALVKYYRDINYHVIGVCRQASSELSANCQEIITGISMQDNQAIRSLKHILGDRHIDILINNAGILYDESFAELNFESIELQIQVNALAPLRVVSVLTDSLVSGSKVALITSRMGSIEDNTSGGRYGYRMSKAALNAAGKSLSHDLKSDGIAVAILHPGLVSTAMIDFNGQVSPECAAKQLAQRIEDLDLNNTGTFWHANGSILPW